MHPAVSLCAQLLPVTDISMLRSSLAVGKGCSNRWRYSKKYDGVEFASSIPPPPPLPSLVLLPSLPFPSFPSPPLPYPLPSPTFPLLWLRSLRECLSSHSRPLTLLVHFKSVHSVHCNLPRLHHHPLTACGRQRKGWEGI